MNITEIRTGSLTDYKPFVGKKVDTKKVDNPAVKSTKHADVNQTSWQKNVLLTALDSIESKITTDGSYPLDKVSNAPIDTFEEAMIELSFIKTPLFRKEASNAQANIKPEDVVALFTEESS